jgi:hypothetical protein
MLRRIFGPKREETAVCWRRLHNEELRNFYASPVLWDGMGGSDSTHGREEKCVLSFGRRF